MSFPFLIALGLPLFLSPILTHSILSESYEWQEVQVRLDNAAIELGQSDRTLFNNLRMANKAIQVLEIPHHVAHLCARSGNPFTAAACSSQDIAFEQQIRILHQSAGRIAQALWQKNSIQVYSEVIAIDPVGFVDRVKSAPIKNTRCPICFMETEWEVSSKPVTSQLYVTVPKNLTVEVKMKGDSLRSGEKWDYQLETGEEE